MSTINALNAGACSQMKLRSRAGGRNMWAYMGATTVSIPVTLSISDMSSDVSRGHLQEDA